MSDRYAVLRGGGFNTQVDLELAVSLPTGTSNLATTTGAGEAPPNLLSVGRGAIGSRAQALEAIQQLKARP